MLFRRDNSYKQKIHLSTTLETFGPAMMEGLNADFSFAAQSKAFALAIFPLISSERQLDELIQTLSGDARWTSDEIARDADHRRVELRWRNPEGLDCNAVGFAPTLPMPVTRRAPYVAVGVWPGGHDNQFLKNHGQTIGLADTSHNLDEQGYQYQLQKPRLRSTNSLVAVSPSRICGDGPSAWASRE
jgi:hypothetical protein